MTGLPEPADVKAGQDFWGGSAAAGQQETDPRWEALGKRGERIHRRVIAPVPIHLSMFKDSREALLSSLNVFDALWLMGGREGAARHCC